MKAACDPAVRQAELGVYQEYLCRLRRRVLLSQSFFVVPGDRQKKAYAPHFYGPVHSSGVPGNCRSRSHVIVSTTSLFELTLKLVPHVHTQVYKDAQPKLKEQGQNLPHEYPGGGGTFTI